MKLEFSKNKRSRIKNSRFSGFTQVNIPGLWFDNNINQWTENPVAGKKGYSSHQGCKSVKAFRRKLKNAPFGVEFILVSWYKGCDVIGYGSKIIK